jgi:hypothetical protein
MELIENLVFFKNIVYYYNVSPYGFFMIFFKIIFFYFIF